MNARLNDPIVERATREELEDAFRDTVDAVGYAEPVSADAAVAERIAERQIVDGTHLRASDGTHYVVSNLQHRYVPMVVARRHPNDPAAGLERMLDVGTRSTLTLRRLIPKVRGKAARREDKQLRMAMRHESARSKARAAQLEALHGTVDWQQLDAEVR